jgi:hypothetical protein
MAMNQPEDGPMAKSLAAAQIDKNVEDLGTLIETISRIYPSSHSAVRTPLLWDPVNEESYRPSLPSSGVVLTRIIPSVITGMTSREKSLTRTIALVHPSMEPFWVAPRPATLAPPLPPLRMHVMPLQTSREA